ncbi:hypothetical protein [Methylocaldum sp.]|uniref:hypothetical protein n=1 Tax=Methylocaldum sp. TaxID=1969727 RepID=UPI002D281D36|nr:hypothetical protein [Methylocaldum sp.]HYE34213.1 hypothetical protein [Methylocaldum sp.]
MPHFLSIFPPSTAEERRSNFESYWAFSLRRAGDLLEKEKDLANKRDKLNYFKRNPVRSRLPLRDPEAFYRNCVHLQDDPHQLDRKVLLLTCIYKFARHEWAAAQLSPQVLEPFYEGHAPCFDRRRQHPLGTLPQ